MTTDNLFEQFANISKAHAYDIVSAQAQELAADNKELKAALNQFINAVQQGSKVVDAAENAIQLLNRINSRTLKPKT